MSANLNHQCTVKVTETVQSSRRRAWIYVELMMVCILLTLPITPILWRTATKIFGSPVNAVGYAFFLLLLVGFGVYTIRLHPKSKIAGTLPLFGFALVYLYLLKYQCQFPAERLHLMEYGLLAYLFYRALRNDFPSKKAYVLGFLFASVFGFFDEAIQYVLPNRVFEIRDVMTNVMAAGLGLLAVKVLIKPDLSRAPEAETER